MNIELFQEKMDPLHRQALCRMLKMKQLPEQLLERYVQVKRMTDRIDARLSPGVLALIAMSAGVEELTSQVEGKVKQPLDKAVDEAVDEAVEQPTEPLPTKSDKLWAPGMPVNVLQNDELKEGKIVGIRPPAKGSGDWTQLTIMLEDGDTILANENEVEAV